MTFWNQWDATNHWLASIAKSPTKSELWMRAKGLGPLSPWLQDDRAQLNRLFAWTDATSVAPLWRYWSVFARETIQSIQVPCGNESWVEYIPGQAIHITAPQANWLWQETAQAWGLESWVTEESESWTEQGRTQHAWRYPCTFMVVRQLRPGFKEWTLRALPDQNAMIDRCWALLVERLGVRAVRLSWRPSGHGAQGLGPCRVDEAWLRLEPTEVIPLGYRSRSLAGLRLEARWTVPDWAPHWTVRVSLMKAGVSYPRLQALFEPRTGEVDERYLRAEARRLPILELSALPFSETIKDGQWQDVKQWVAWHSQAQSLVKACRDFQYGTSSSRERLPRGWRYSRLESGHGSWVIRHHQHSISIHLSWPHSVHPGHISLNVGGVVNVDLDDLDPSGLVDRWDPDWRYWQNTINRLLYRVGAWITSQESRS